jgi:hypothetical protein
MILDREYLPRAYNAQTHLTRAWVRSVLIDIVQPAAFGKVAIRSRRHFRLEKSNRSIGAVRKRQQPGFRCSGRVMCRFCHSPQPLQLPNLHVPNPPA